MKTYLAGFLLIILHLPGYSQDSTKAEFKIKGGWANAGLGFNTMAWKTANITVNLELADQSLLSVGAERSLSEILQTDNARAYQQNYFGMLGLVLRQKKK